MARRRTVSRSELLEIACALANEHGDGLTLVTFLRETGLSHYVVFERFGSWRTLRSAAGLSADVPRRQVQKSGPQILALTKELAERYGEELTVQLFTEETGVSRTVVRDRFGSWGALRQSAGLKPRAGCQRYYSREEMLEDLYRVWWNKGTPRFHQHKWNGGRIGAQTIRNEFGRWEVVIAAYEAHRRRVEGRSKPLPEGTPWTAKRFGETGETGDGGGED